MLSDYQVLEVGQRAEEGRGVRACLPACLQYGYCSGQVCVWISEPLI